MSEKLKPRQEQPNNSVNSKNLNEESMLTNLDRRWFLKTVGKLAVGYGLIFTAIYRAQDEKAEKNVTPSNTIANLVMTGAGAVIVSRVINHDEFTSSDNLASSKDTKER